MRAFLECSREEAESLAQVLLRAGIPFSVVDTQSPLAGGLVGLGSTGINVERVVICIPGPRHAEAEAVLTDPWRDDEFEDWMQDAFDAGP